MIYLGNNQIGFDTAAIGFPSILACEAIVYQTDRGLYGLHEMPGQTGAFAGKVAAFAAYVQGHAMNHAAQALSLYAVINQNHRNFDTGWEAELESVARALNFMGVISGARITGKHIGKSDSVYVRFDAAGTACAIQYKRWSKMENDKVGVAPPDQFEFQKRQATALEKSDAALAKQYYENPQFKLTGPSELFTPVHRKGKDTEGQLNSVTQFEITTRL